VADEIGDCHEGPEGRNSITSRRWRFISKQDDGVYPNWRQAVPNEFNSTVEINDAESLIQMIQRMPDYDRTFHRICLSLENGKLVLLAKADKDDPWKTFTVSDAKVRGKNTRAFINREYLTKALHFGLNMIELTDELNSVKMSSEGRQMIIAHLSAEASSASTPPAANGTGESKPAAQAPAAQPEERNPTMPRNNGNGSPHTEPKDEKPTMEKALADIEKIKGSYREAIRRLSDLGDMLKAISKERKSTEKEVQSVRSTLEKLQSVRI